MSLSTQLKALRKEHGLTQKMLADRINVSRSTVTGYETKDRQPSHETLSAMAELFGVSIDFLIDANESDDSSSSIMSPQEERLLDQKVLKIYRSLSQKSKEDTLEYLHLLTLREKEEQTRKE